MKKITLLFAVFFLLSGTLSSPVVAAKTKHRPWFSHGEKTTSVVRQKARPRVAVRRAAPARPSVRQASIQHAGQKIALQAKKYQGTKYRFGGTSKSKGFDCSGLVARVWADLKLKKVPRSSAALYRAGMPVGLPDLREGDLVFFKNTYKRGISHVGVYTGRNKFVHAPSSGKRVSITRLSDPYYQLHYAGARRLY
jgi:murein DD-endopeptidase